MNNVDESFLRHGIRPLRKEFPHGFLMPSYKEQSSAGRQATCGRQLMSRKRKDVILSRGGNCSQKRVAD